MYALLLKSHERMYTTPSKEDWGICKISGF